MREPTRNAIATIKPNARTLKPKISNTIGCMRAESSGVIQGFAARIALIAAALREGATRPVLCDLREERRRGRGGASRMSLAARFGITPLARADGEPPQRR